MTEETYAQRKAHIAALRRLNSALPKEQRHAIPSLNPAHQPKKRQPSGHTVESMLALSRADYTSLVCGHLRAEDEDAWSYFLDPQLLQLTHSVLVRKHAVVAETRDGSPADRRRRDFLDMLQSRIQQAEELLPDDVLPSQLAAARRLFGAIQTHRRALAKNGIEPEAWDLKLWKAADDFLASSQGECPGEHDRSTPIP